LSDITAVREFLVKNAEGDLVAWRCQTDAMRRFGLTCADVELLILEAGLLPKRYQRNRRMFSAAEQRRLFESRVAVVGCGGLGGYVIEELARLGVGRLVAIDPDSFDEGNLNRQLLSSPALIGTSKALAAARRVAEVNPAVGVEPVQSAFAPERSPDLLAGVAVVVDALDTIADRLELGKACSRLGIPLVSGSIGGWFGYVTAVFPGEQTLKHLYRSDGRGIEADLGNPAFTPAAVASLQVAEVVKILLRIGTTLRNRVLCVNLFDMEVDCIRLDGSPASYA
jgi:molybdopterin/thiamine biosynthesis adenylyltransferase